MAATSRALWTPNSRQVPVYQEDCAEVSWDDRLVEGQQRTPESDARREPAETLKGWSSATPNPFSKVSPQPASRVRGGQKQFSSFTPFRTPPKGTRTSLTPAERAKYRTEMCRNKADPVTGLCTLYGEKCRYAHNREELRQLEKNPKYRTKPCTNWAVGYCEYGQMCDYIHDPSIPQKPHPGVPLALHRALMAATLHNESSAGNSFEFEAPPTVRNVSSSFSVEGNLTPSDSIQEVPQKKCGLWAGEETWMSEGDSGCGSVDSSRRSSISHAHEDVEEVLDGVSCGDSGFDFERPASNLFLLKKSGDVCQQGVRDTSRIDPFFSPSWTMTTVWKEGGPRSGETSYWADEWTTAFVEAMVDALCSE